jgi:hypothetical protein
MPYVPPHLRSTTYYDDEKRLPKIATTPAEAQAMSHAVMSTPKSGTSLLSDMLSKPAPRLAGKVSAKKVGPKPKIPTATTRKALQESAKIVSATPAPLANVIATRAALSAAAPAPIASGSFSGMIPAPKPVKAHPPKIPKAPKVKPIISPAVQQASQMTVTTNNTPAFDAAMDDILRTIFEESMRSVKRTALANVGDFTRKAQGSYKNERLESRYQGFKLQKLEDHAGKASDELETILREKFQVAMQGVKRIASAHALDFTKRANGSYVNERLESRFQGYLMASVNDFGLAVLRKIADNRVAALKSIR